MRGKNYLFAFSDQVIILESVMRNNKVNDTKLRNFFMMRVEGPTNFIRCNVLTFTGRTRETSRTAIRNEKKTYMNRSIVIYKHGLKGAS